MSILYIVSTPIGNLADITYRAVKTLQEVDVIACEDTRHSQRLLGRYDIHKRLIACHAKNEKSSAAGIIKLLSEGKQVAYVSDAGTPGISDPGSRLVSAVRESGYQVVPIPGASAFATLFSVAGFMGKSTLFEGFLSPKSGRRETRLKELLSRQEAFVLYESPFRVLKVLKALSELAPQRQMIVGREMTKAFEEYVTGTAEEVFSVFEQRDSIKGEFALLVAGPQKEDTGNDDNDQEAL